MMKVIVDELPDKSKDCIFAEYIGMTSKYKCMFQSGMYSRCNLDCGKECPYLKRGAEKDSEEILFTLENGDIFRMYHEQDCCEDVRVEDVGGDINRLIGNPLLLAEEVTNEGEVEYGDTCTWT